MSKIICDVCGTTYQDTAQCCPICGCTRDEAAGMMSDELMMDELLSDTGAKNGRNSSRKREIFDFDEVNSGSEKDVESLVDPYDEEDAEDDEPQRHNTLAVIILTALIAILLIGAAFLFLRFYLPGVTEEETVPPTTMAQAPETTAAPTTDPSIPCDSLALISGMATGDAALATPGQKFLIHVIASPENTTDEIIYTSADESVATVSADGQVVAVGEGETVINITCGKIQIPCKVVCSFIEETEPPTTEAATVPTTEATTAPEVVLKLEKSDVTLKVFYECQLMLDCDLKQTDVEWSSEYPNIAKVDEEGNVTALMKGATDIIAKYGDQEVRCIVRCQD